MVTDRLSRYITIYIRAGERLEEKSGSRRARSTRKPTIRAVSQRDPKTLSQAGVSFNRGPAARRGSLVQKVHVSRSLEDDLRTDLGRPCGTAHKLKINDELIATTGH